MEEFIFLVRPESVRLLSTAVLLHLRRKRLSRERTYGEGTLQHAAPIQAKRSTRDGALQFRSVYLYAKQLGVCGKADVIEERAGELYPGRT